MRSNQNTPRFLGAAFLLQAVAAVIWTALLEQLIVPGSIAESMTNIADNVLQMRASILVAMITVMGIVMLGSLLFDTLRNQNEQIARVALGLYLIEVAILAVSRIPAFALLRISQESTIAGHPAHLQTLGQLFYEAAEYGDWLHMLPFALGATLFYFLFFKSRYIPRPLAIFGLIAASLSLVATPLVLLGIDVPIFVVALNFPFEVGIGLWLLVKGIKEN